MSSTTSGAATAALSLRRPASTARAASASTSIPIASPKSEANAKRAGVERLVKFRLQDALTADVSEASVVTLYLLSSSNMKLRPLLTKQLRPGARIVSQSFGMGDWTPEKIDDFKDGNVTARKLFLWTGRRYREGRNPGRRQGRTGARPLRGLGPPLGLGGAAAEVAVHVEQ